MAAMRIAFVGDSVTHGVGDQCGIGWPGRLVERAQRHGHAITSYNLGIRSETSEQMAARWRSETACRLPAAAARAIVFSFGLNDATRVQGESRVPLARAETVARAMLSDAATFCPVLWIGPTAIDDSTQPLRSSLGIMQAKSNAETAQYDACYQRLAHQLGVPYLALFPVLSSQSSWMGMLVDGVHPNADGYSLMADMIDQWRPWQELLGAATSSDESSFENGCGGSKGSH